ncbi:MAG: hypothetical protein GY805_24900 [Chloroflexi bacterium]|nr:hypothetical protein [Chloroflexota bacterium]
MQRTQNSTFFFFAPFAENNTHQTVISTRNGRLAHPILSNYTSLVATVGYFVGKIGDV